MRAWRRMRIALVALAVGCAGGAAQAALVINLGSHDATVGSTDVNIPITISGGDAITDMAAYVQIGDGGPLVGGTNGPKIKSISYAGSVWAGAGGGFTPFLSAPLPGQIIDPSLSLNTSGQSVPGEGTLATLVVDVSGYAVGSTFDLKMKGTAAGDSAFARSGNAVPVTINNGTLRIVAVPEPSWMALGAAAPVAAGGRRRRGGKRITGA